MNYFDEKIVAKRIAAFGNLNGRGLEDAFSTFRKLKDTQKPDAAVYHAFLSACQKNQHYAKGLALLDEMIWEMESRDGLFDAVSFTILAESCAKQCDSTAANNLLSIWQREINLA